MNNLDSEIVNQKKQFIFDVEATSTHPFPKEDITFYIYIKNISGVNIENFKIKIEKEDDFFFKKEIPENDEPVTLKNNQSKLYDMIGYCKDTGKYHIHFIAYGEGTQLQHDIVTINCNRIYNSEKLLHRIHIYDFNPYENKYSLEADDYSSEVAQTFKRQKLPYLAGKQPFPPQKVDKNIMNKESQSFLDQLYGVGKIDGLKNIDEHSYQYISRETFTEDSIENYTGENLFDIINQINQESEYFKAEFIRSGNNTLLNDFTQYKPNGLIYRFGLLSSEIYHKLGVLPSFSYMNDIIFRWAPSPTGQHLFLMGEIQEGDNFNLINLYPKTKAMRWGENVWAGNGWDVFKVVTEQYAATDEFKNKLENHKINLKEHLGFFENKTEAENFIREQEQIDNNIRNYQQNDMIKYIYTLKESLYSPGVFFVNIPLGKIPTNFYLTSTKELYNIVNRAKPFGMKPIINYVIEKEFDSTVKQGFTPDYSKEFIFNLQEPDIKYRICENSLISKEIDCYGETVSYVSEEPIKCVLYDVDTNINMNMETESSFSISDTYEQEMIQNYKGYNAHVDQSLTTLGDIKEVLYNNNYNNISFYIPSKLYSPITFTNEIPKTIINYGEEDKVLQYSNIINGETLSDEVNFDSLKISVSKTKKKTLCFIDNLERIYKFSAEYDDKEKMYKFSHIYENTEGKKTVKKIGYQDIKSIGAAIMDYNNRTILILLVEDEKNKLHYFNHIILQELQEFDVLIDDIKVNDNITVSVFDKISFEPIVFETPFCYVYETYTPSLIKGGENWDNLYRINSLNKRFSSIENKTKDDLIVEPLSFIYDNINIPETSIIKKIRFNIDCETRGKNNYITVSKSQSNNYKIEGVEGNSLQLRPTHIECYPQSNESNVYYQEKLDLAVLKDQETLIKEYNNLMNENDLFNEDIELNIDDLGPNNNFITVDKPYWVEISNFKNNNQYQTENIKYDLNKTTGIYLILEGYNNGNEIRLLAQTSSETNNSSEVSEKIPEGYFYKKVPLLYPNQFLTDILRVRFRFKGLNNEIKIFNSAIEVRFKDKEPGIYKYKEIKESFFNKKEEIDVYDLKAFENNLEEYLYSADIDNGLEIKLAFNPLKSGDFYHINSIQLEIIYQDSDIEMMINKNKYHYVSDASPQLTIEGKSTDAYISGLFYNDVTSVNQIKSNISYKNKGAILKDAIFQSFESRDDNITSIEIFPNGFVGNPDETLKIGLYTNNGNSPGKLIKEVYANGWVKNNEELKNLNSIKYNLNINNLKINEKYWFKIQVVNPRENSYYLLKDFDETLPQYKMLFRENNNYINSFNILTFNIYSQNLSRSFRDVPTIQEYFNNPYILIGLHRGQGEIKDLLISKYDSDITEDKNMKEKLDSTIEQGFDIKVLDENGNVIKETDSTKNEWENR